MFEKVYVRRFETIARGFSLGLVAELALYYKQLIVEINIGWLSEALKTTSIDTLKILHKEFGVRFLFMTDFMGVVREVPQGSFIPRYFISTAEVSMTRERADGREEIAARVLRANPNANKNDIIGFLGICEFKHLNDIMPKGLKIDGIVGIEILDKPLSAADISEIVSSIAPSYQLPDDVIFHGSKRNPKDIHFMLSSNIDLTELNKHRVYQSGEAITNSHLLSMYGNARFELSACANQDADFVSDDVSGAIIRRRVSDLLDATKHRNSEIELFQERTLGDSKAIAQAIDSGSKSLDDFLGVLEQASRFKGFISHADTELGLIDQYIKEVSSRSWIDSLPAKSLRFGIFQVAAIAAGVMLNPVTGAAVGLGAGALDSFVVEKLMHRWRPNQFVDDVLKPFASGR